MSSKGRIRRLVCLGRCRWRLLSRVGKLDARLSSPYCGIGIGSMVFIMKEDKERRGPETATGPSVCLCLLENKEEVEVAVGVVVMRCGAWRLGGRQEKRNLGARIAMCRQRSTTRVWRIPAVLQRLGKAGGSFGAPAVPRRIPRWASATTRVPQATTKSSSAAAGKQGADATAFEAAKNRTKPLHSVPFIGCA